jgi:hypothetical protein
MNEKPLTLDQLIAYVRHRSEDPLPERVRIGIYELLVNLSVAELRKRGPGAAGSPIRSLQARMIHELCKSRPKMQLKVATSIALQFTGDSEKNRATVEAKYRAMRKQKGAFKNIHISDRLRRKLIDALPPRKK